MAGEFLLLSPEYLEATGVAVGGSSSATAATMPWLNLLNGFPWRKARTSSLTGMTLELDLGVARAIDTVVLHYTNARAETDWRIRLADTQGGLATATGDDDSGTIDFWPASTPATAAADWPNGTLGFWRPASTRTRRWLKFDFTDATHPDGYFEAGVLIVAEAWQPAKSSFWPREDPTELEPDGIVRSESGMAFPQPQGRPAFAAYLLNRLQQAEYRALRRIFRLRGTSKHVATVLDPTNTGYLHENLFHGYLRSISPIRVNPPASGYEWAARLELESAAG